MSQSSDHTSYSNNIENLKLAATGDSSAIEELMKNNEALVRKIASGFEGRGVEREDLLQIGSIGMLKAIRSFDMSRGNSFSTYAVPLIIGEIRRFLRDDGIIHISRVYKKNIAMIMHSREQYLKQNGIEPQLSELSERTGLSKEEITETMSIMTPVRSLSEPVSENGELSLEDTIPSDSGIDHRIELIALKESLSKLPPLWRKIVLLRYFKEYSQTQTADMLGLTQVKVSREEKKIFELLRSELNIV